MGPRFAFASLVALCGGCFVDQGLGGDSGVATDTQASADTSTTTTNAGTSPPTTGTGGSTGDTAPGTGTAGTGAGSTGAPTTSTTGHGRVPGEPYDLAENVCDADWSSGAGTLSCPGEKGDLDGSVVTQALPPLEAEVADGEIVVVLQPDYVTTTTIEGIFPPLQIVEGDRFSATLGCGAFETNCDFDWEIRYESDADAGVLVSGSEFHDGELTAIDADLADLVGEEVVFSLSIHAGVKYSSHDVAYFVDPKISAP